MNIDLAKIFAEQRFSEKGAASNVVSHEVPQLIVVVIQASNSSSDFSKSVKLTLRSAIS